MNEQKDYHKTYYQKNKEKMDKTSKMWKKLNKDKWNQYQKEYKKRKYHEQKLKAQGEI